MRLKVGEQAPEFAVEDVRGQTIKLRDYANRHVLLCFFRYAGCPFCQLLVRKLGQRYQKLQAHNISIIAFFQSPRESVLKYPGKLNPPFPLIADPQESIYHLYGIETSLLSVVRGALNVQKVYETFIKEKLKQGKVDGDFFLMPGYFFIGPPDLAIQKAVYTSSFADHHILEELDMLMAQKT